MFNIYQEIKNAPDTLAIFIFIKELRSLNLVCSSLDENRKDRVVELQEHMIIYFKIILELSGRTRDTRPQAARTLQVHVFELDPKIFELNEFM